MDGTCLTQHVDAARCSLTAICSREITSSTSAIPPNAKTFVTVFNPTIAVVTFRLRGWCMLGVFLLSRTGMSISSESAPWNACARRRNLGLYSHPKEFGGNGARNHVNSRGKILSTGGSEEVRTRDAAPRKTASPTHYGLSYSATPPPPPPPPPRPFVFQ